MPLPPPGLPPDGGPADLLERVVAAVRANPSIEAKRELGLVGEVLGAADWVTGPGDDGAVIEVEGATVIACGEALFPPFVAADPRGAGIAAVLANVNDVVAMGGEPLAILDTVVADRDTARLVLEGLRDAAAIYRVPIVGGHLTIREGPASVSAFAVGRADAVLSSTRASVGQDLVVAACTQGSMRSDFPFFASFDERGQRLADDVRLLAGLARRGLASAAKDISMAGLVGSLAMLLEGQGLGVGVDLALLPAPEDVDLALWCNCFPCYGFLLCCDPPTTDACCAVFHEAGLSAERVGTLDATGVIRLRLGEHERPVFDLNRTPVTGLTRAHRAQGWATDSISS